MDFLLQSQICTLFFPDLALAFFHFCHFTCKLLLTNFLGLKMHRRHEINFLTKQSRSDLTVSPCGILMVRMTKRSCECVTARARRHFEQ